MAKINARGAHRLGPTLFTRRVRPAGAYDVETIYYEAFRLRSDGVIQTRIIRSVPMALEEGRESVGREIKHSSAFRNIGAFSASVRIGNPTPLRSWLESKGFEIVQESWR